MLDHIPEKASDMSFDPIPIEQEYIELLRTKGVTLYTSTDSQMSYLFTTLNDGDLAEALTVLPLNTLQWIQHSCSLNSRLPDIIPDAVKLKRLEVQQEIQVDGFPVPTSIRPLTWPLRDLLPGEFSHLQTELRKQGISEVLIGLEVELTADEYPFKENSHWAEIKKSILSNLEARIESSLEPEKTNLIEKRAAVLGFNAREVLMYDIVELDSRTKDIVEHIFGKEHADGSYYDGQNVLELQLKPDDPEAIRDKLKLLTKVLYEKGNEYGLLVEAPQVQINMSFWDAQGNLFDPQHFRFAKQGAKIASGMLRTLYDSYPLLETPEMLNSKRSLPFRMDIDRVTDLRFTPGKMEVRPYLWPEYQDIGMIIAVGLAGALYGLKKQHETDLVEVQTVKIGKFKASTPNLKVFTHVLQGSQITTDGQIIPPDSYVQASAETLAEELGILPDDYVKKMDLAHPVARGARGPASFSGFFVEMFRSIRIDPNGTLLWPEWMNSTPEGTSGPVDFTLLKEGIQFEGSELSLSASEGYNLDHVMVEGSREPVKRSRVKRMLNSEALQTTLSKDFRSKLNSLLGEIFGDPDLSVPREHLNEVLKLLAPGDEWDYREGTDRYRREVESFLTDAEFEDALNMAEKILKVALAENPTDIFLYYMAGRGGMPSAIFMSRDLYQYLEREPLEF